MRNLYSRAALEGRTKFFEQASFVSFYLSFDTSELAQLQYVSVTGTGTVCGYFEAKVNRLSNIVEQVRVLRFPGRNRSSFARDVFNFLDLLLLTRRFRKITFQMGNGANG